ncbi:membrane hypothetical protein [Frankia sp. AiPs1]|uniref:hypothetical protein n=1 Tax=Frankia sp. AiPa1 TaxID=573492 RepID=UPI00202B3E3A|nr:hypothetical protein [Frankia sp. AiPa1]MCL9758957.1 hypothetical protein [Frankia sp. AiPa1]
MVAALLASPVVWCHYLLPLVAPLLTLSRAAGSPAVATGQPATGQARTESPRPEHWRQPERPRPAAPRGRDARPIAPVPVALFAAGSWLLVTPHRTTGADLAVTALIGVPLALSCLVGAGRRRPFAGRPRPLFPTVILVASRPALIGAFGVLLVGFAAVHAAGARVIGPFAVCVGVGVFLVFAARNTAARGPSGPPRGLRAIG